MAKKKGAVNINMDNLLDSIGGCIDSINPEHNYDAEEARIEKAIGCGSRLIDAIVGSPEQPGVLFIGRITELLAVEGTGKTTLYVQTCAQAQRLGYNVVYFDTEMKSFSVTHMERLGVDFKAKGSVDGSSKGFFKIIKCGTIEEIDAHLMSFEKNGLAEHIDVIIIDSVATAITQKQLELGVGDSRQLGQHAYGIQKLFGKIRVMKEKYQWAVGTINQMRRAPDIGGMFQAKAVNVKGIGGSNDTSWTKTGGRAYLHDLHQAVFMDNYKVEKNEAGEILKQFVKVTTTKNMVGSTGRKVFVKLVQNEGFKDDETMIEYLQEWGYIQHTSGGKYDVYDSTEDDVPPAITVKGVDNLLPEIKKVKGLLDRLYDLFFILSQDAIEADASSDEEDEDEDDEMDVE